MFQNVLNASSVSINGGAPVPCHFTRAFKAHCKLKHHNGMFATSNALIAPRLCLSLHRLERALIESPIGYNQQIKIPYLGGSILTLTFFKNHTSSPVQLIAAQ